MKNILIICTALILSVSYTAKAEYNKKKVVDKFFTTTDSAGVKVLDIERACGGYFENQFNTKENVSRKATCNGYFFAIGGTLLSLQMSGVDTGICLPGDVTTEQIVRAFLQWKEKRGGEVNEYPAAEGALTALKDKYNCLKAR